MRGCSTLLPAKLPSERLANTLFCSLYLFFVESWLLALKPFNLRYFELLTPFPLFDPNLISSDSWLPIRGAVIILLPSLLWPKESDWLSSSRGIKLELPLETHFDFDWRTDSLFYPLGLVTAEFAALDARRLFKPPAVTTVFSVDWSIDCWSIKPRPLGWSRFAEGPALVFE